MNLPHINWDTAEVSFRYLCLTCWDSLNLKLYFSLLLQLFITKSALFLECCEISRVIMKSSEIMEWEGEIFVPTCRRYHDLNYTSGGSPGVFLSNTSSLKTPGTVLKSWKKLKIENPNNESSSENQQWFLWNKNENIARPDCDLLLEWKWLQICVLVNQLQAIHYL